jgi:hypothetical protein
MVRATCKVKETFNLKYTYIHDFNYLLHNMCYETYHSKHVETKVKSGVEPHSVRK